MDKNRIDGIARQAKGTIKEATGKITGNEKLQAEGKAEKIAGQAQEKLGKAKDAVTKTFK
ncbi:CsbD family protein [Agrobacterium genomosp. 13]|uniref:CsbD-like protein n=1 Tax=Agrobacterium genomosp. 13 str. CFBP 6927 TaxID=1183428 RepID=A0ABP2BRL0_9HYPH|nr:CsbD family protein [Agrobacterium genomosp. 13]CUX56977.1 CsbD-like protein [Agrobacterium genomosp. 13 str. CFBP 6927]